MLERVDVDVPGPVVVADLLFHSIRNGCKDAAPQHEAFLVDRTGFDTADVLVVPVDVALDRPVPTKDEAVALGSSRIAVAATPDVSLLRAIQSRQRGNRARGGHPTASGRVQADRSAASRASSRERTSNSDFLWFSTFVSSIVKREVFQSVSVAIIAVSALLPRWYVASGLVLTGNPFRLAYSCASQIAGRSSCTPSPTAPNRFVRDDSSAPTDNVGEKTASIDRNKIA